MEEYDEQREKELVHQLRLIAGEIGAMNNELDGGSDSENYEFQVHVGLANAIVEVLDYDTDKVITWLFGYCLIRLGVTNDDRIAALLDALKREVEVQLDEAFDDEDGTGQDGQKE